jgi:cytidyltransferase-like protein
MRVWVNGCFDVLHIGHIELLRYAATFGSVRVGIDTDERVKKLKGEGRPFNTTAERVSFLRELRSVNEVVWYDSEEELEQQIKSYRPDYLIIGSDYIDKPVIGASHAKLGVVYFDRIKNKSTSEILAYEHISNR